ncbi:hypothetical protein IEE_03925 [Bacillus cereus BAG5X1-1]|uniref:Uncharacterized protein n=1 Tax=Bacillus cereus BAG5X1-1 TaxID=1053189 RepID=J8ASD5_BACCE|nr:hypothetical protein [Bacillus cereus]EJQ42360.1 hypothetical protein IEE_03925 [Bacillus cereus BAG5X1-1]
MEIERFLARIEGKVSEIEREFQRIQGLILTEDDLKSILFSKLMSIPEFFSPRQTRDSNIYATALHTEVSFFNEAEELRIIPDISIIEPEHLSILHFFNDDGLDFPSKQYSFGGKAIIFELKFIRNKNGITYSKFRNEILKDFEKIQELFQRLDNLDMSNDVFCYFIIFNKTDIYCNQFQEFLETHRNDARYKIIYATADVNFNNE